MTWLILLYLHLPHEFCTNCGSVVLQQIQKCSVCTSWIMTSNTYWGQRSFKFKLLWHSLIQCGAQWPVLKGELFKRLYHCILHWCVNMSDTGKHHHLLPHKCEKNVDEVGVYKLTLLIFKKEWCVRTLVKWQCPKAVI